MLREWLKCSIGDQYSWFPPILSFLGFKNEGNDLFKQGKYKEAIDAYSKGIDIDPDNHVLFSNRSAAYLKEQERGKVSKYSETRDNAAQRNISWR